MAKSELTELHRRRELLVAQAEHQRSQIARMFHALEVPEERIRTGASYLRLLKSPFVLGALGFILYKTRVIRLLRLPVYAWKIFRFFNRTRGRSVWRQIVPL